MTLSPGFARCAGAAPAGTAVPLSIPLSIALEGIFSAPLRWPDGSPDDAHTPLLLAMLFAGPFVFLALAIFNTLLLRAMLRFGVFERKALVVVFTGSTCVVVTALGSELLGLTAVVSSSIVGALLSWRLATSGSARAPR